MERKTRRSERPQISTDTEIISEYKETARFYEYMRKRHQQSPIFLNRTLRYMSHRSLKPRFKINRKNVKVDNFFLDKPPKLTIQQTVDEIKCPEYKFRLVITKSISRDTEIKRNADCPWCWLKCRMLEKLVQHVKMTHLDFEVNFVKDSESIQIVEIKLMESRMRLKEYRRNDFCKRTYIHPYTNLPMPFHEVMKPKVENLQTPWVLQRIQRNIDDFADVNDEEKEILIMWSIFVTKFIVSGDCHLPRIIDMFIETHGREILEKKLLRNFTLHLVNLVDYHCITPREMFEAIQSLRRFISENNLENLIRNYNSSNEEAVDPDGEIWITSSQGDSGISCSNHSSQDSSVESNISNSQSD